MPITFTTTFIANNAKLILLINNWSQGLGNNKRSQGLGKYANRWNFLVLYKNKTSLFHYPSNHLVTNKGAIEREARHVLLIVIMSLDKGSSRLSMRSTITAPQSHYYQVLLQVFLRTTYRRPQAWPVSCQWYGPFGMDL